MVRSSNRTVENDMVLSDTQSKRKCIPVYSLLTLVTEIASYACIGGLLTTLQSSGIHTTASQIVKSVNKLEMQKQSTESGNVINSFG